MKELDGAGVDIGGTTHRRGVPEVFGHLLHGGLDGPLPSSRRGRRQIQIGQFFGRQYDGVPGAKVLGAELLTGHIFYEGIHVVRTNVHPTTLVWPSQQLRPTAPARLQSVDG